MLDHTFHCLSEATKNIFVSRGWDASPSYLPLPPSLKPGFHMSGKLQTIGDFTFLPTIPDFARDISDIRQRSVPDVRETIRLFVIEELALSNLGD